MKKVPFLFIGFVIGLIFGLFLIQIFNISIDSSKTHSMLETVYYITAPIGILLTASAVVVAIWGNDIRAWFNKEKCEVEIENGGFVEDVRGIEDDENMSARQYNCNLIIRNIGPKEIDNCTVYITKIIYKKREDSKEISIGISNRKALYWFDQDIKSTIILKDEQKVIPVLRVYPDNNNQTPDQNNTRVIPKRISIVGFSIDERYSKKGFWEIHYIICNSHKSIRDFKLVVSWDGKWHRREKEMNESLTVNIE